jgi:LPXTG-motif cell wall-anchored protein
VVAGLVALLLVLGPGAAFADETAPAATETTAPEPAPVDAPVDAPPSAPVEEPADEAPAPAPVDEPADQTPAPSTPSETPEEPAAPAEEPATDGADAPAAPAADAPVKATLADAILAKAFAALAAEAAIPVPCVGGPATVVGGYEIDGNNCAQTHHDWDTTGLYTEDGLGDSTSFAGGNSEGDDPADWAGGGPVPNGKSDIGDFWAYSQVNGGDVYGFFAITNDSTSGGTSQYDVEYNQQDNIAQGGITVPDRTPGDLLFRFSSTGSDPIVFTDAKRWTLESDDAWDEVTCEDITDDAGWCTIPIPGGVFAQQVNADGTFFEGAINISLLIGEGNCSGNFGVVQVRSVTGGSFYTSSLKDYVDPLGVNTPSTCGSIIIEKNDTDGNPLGGATFSVSPNPDPNELNDTPYSITDNDANDKNPADGVIEINPADPNEEYTVTETDAPDGYLLPIPASQGPAFVGETGSVTFTFEDPKQWEALTAEKSAEETYTAEYDWSIIKEISATGDAPWSDATTEGSPLITTIPADADPTVLPFFYRVKVTEGARTTSDYVVSGNISVTNPNDEAVEADISDSLPDATCLVEGEATLTVDVPADATTDYAYVCTFDGTPAELEGTNTATVSWDISDYPQDEGDQVVDGDYSISPDAEYAFGEETTAIDKTVTVTDDNHVFDPAWVIEWTAEGTESVSDVYEIELSAPAGECSEVLANTATVTGDEDVLGSDTAYGQLCTELPTLTLAKVVFNIDGDAVPADFDLTATPVEIEGQDEVTGNGDPTSEGGVVSVPVKAGDYDLSESGLEGYSQVGDWDCGDAVVVDGDTVTVGYGTDITCTVTNGEDVVAPPEPPKGPGPAVLPETGGPNQGLMVGGLAMLLAGLGLVLMGRRKVTS